MVYDIICCKNCVYVCFKDELEVNTWLQQTRRKANEMFRQQRQNMYAFGTSTS